MAIAGGSHRSGRRQTFSSGGTRVRSLRFLLQLFGCTAILTVFDASAQTTPDPVRFYSESVKPLLEKRCFGCHTATAMGGLRMDSPEAFSKGGKSGPPVSPGSASNSLLIQVVT